MNVIIDNGGLVSCNVPSVFSKTDSLYHYITRSAIGIDRHRNADVAWIFTDADRKKAFEMRHGPAECSGTNANPSLKEMKRICSTGRGRLVKPWKMKTAVGGGPTLISDGAIHITNEQERMFMGLAINDRHPRTAMGYTAEEELIILSVEGRFPGIAEGATTSAGSAHSKGVGVCGSFEPRRRGKQLPVDQRKTDHYSQRQNGSAPCSCSFYCQNQMKTELR